jgi:hypothetical protein
MMMRESSSDTSDKERMGDRQKGAINMPPSLSGTPFSSGEGTTGDKFIFYMFPVLIKHTLPIKESTMSYSISSESNSSGFWSLISGSGDNTQQVKSNAKLIRNPSMLATKAHRRSKKSHKTKLKKESSLKTMAAKLTQFTRLTDVTSWNSLHLFSCGSQDAGRSSSPVWFNEFNYRYKEEGSGVEMDEDISLRTAYDFNRV